jgi:hypothetical protein
MAPEVVLRTADSLGAPPALPQPLPAGAEGTLKEVRGDWARFVLPNGMAGWLLRSTVERID